MRKIFWISLILLVPTAAYGQSAPPRKSIPAIAKAANGAVVSIIMADADGNVTAKGTGFFISRDGRILTNYHVIESAEGYSTPTVKLRAGSILTADELLAYDKERDIAIIKVSGEFRTLTLGDSDKLQVGEEIVAIGNPLSLESTVSNGIVSGRRTIEKEGPKDGDKDGEIAAGPVEREYAERNSRFLQITAPISGGSSGGPLFNMRGEVIGITTSKLKGGENLNFAIPINDALQLIYQSEGPEAAANLSGDYACDADVVPTHFTLSVSGQDLGLTIYAQSGEAGEMHFHRDGHHRWIAGGKGDYVHNLGPPGPLFFISDTMHFYLANVFYYWESRGQMIAGARIISYYHLPPMNLRGTCKRIPAK